MQTPGSQITPMTSMVDSPAKRMNAAYERLLRREQEDSEGKGATVRALGSLLVSFEKVNSEMKVIRRDIRRDLREKRKYHSAETKLLKKEKNVLEGLQSAVSNFRRILGVSAFALAARNASQGNFGDAAANASVGLASLLPEIRDFVIGILAVRGIFGGGRGVRGGGNVPITGNASRGLLSKIPKSGMGKWGALGLTALSLLTLPSLLGGNANAQQVVSGEARRERVIAGEQPDIINQRDTNRFSGQLDKFDAILRALSGDGPDVKPKDKKGPKIEPNENVIPFKDDPKDNSSDQSDNSSDNSSSDINNSTKNKVEEYTGQRNRWQRFFDPGQVFSKDDAEEERTGVYTGGRNRWQRIFDPAQVFSKDKKIEPKTKLLNQEDLINLWLLNNDLGEKSLLTGQEYTTNISEFLEGNPGFTDGFNKKDEKVDWNQLYTQPSIINNLTKGETLEKGNNSFFIIDNNDSDIDPNGPKSFLTPNVNFGDSSPLFVDAKFYLSQDKFSYGLIRGQSSTWI